MRDLPDLQANHRPPPQHLWLWFLWSRWWIYQYEKIRSNSHSLVSIDLTLTVPCLVDMFFLLVIPLPLLPPTTPILTCFFWYMFHYVSLKNCQYLQPRLNDHSFPPGLWSMTGRSEALAPLGIWLRPMGKRLGWRTWLMGVLAREWGYDIKLYIKW